MLGCEVRAEVLGGGAGCFSAAFSACAPGVSSGGAGSSSGSCEELAHEKGWSSHYCETTSSPEGVCGGEGFKTEDCALCCPDPNHTGGQSVVIHE